MCELSSEQNSRDIEKQCPPEHRASTCCVETKHRVRGLRLWALFVGLRWEILSSGLPLPFNSSDPRQATLSLFHILQMGVKSAALGESNKIASDGANSPEMGAQRV